MLLLASMAEAQYPTPRFTPTKTRTPAYPSPTPRFPTVTPTHPAYTPTPLPTSTPRASVTPVPSAPPTPAPGAPIVLVLRWPQRGLVVYESGVAKRASDGQPWVIPFETPEDGRVPLVLVKPEQINQQFRAAQDAANRAQDAVAGCYSLLNQIRAEQASMQKPKK